MVAAAAYYQADRVRNVAAGASAIDLQRGLDRGLEAAVNALKAQSKPVSSRKEKAQVATISAHNDPSIGNLVADAMEKVGGDGVITVEESKTTETALEVVEGLQFDRAYLSPLPARCLRRKHSAAVMSEPVCRFCGAPSKRRLDRSLRTLPPTVAWSSIAW